MANTASYGGFRCFQEVLHIGVYAIPTAPTINLCVGDLVQGANSFTVTGKWGTIPTIYVAAVIGTTAGGTYPLYGAIEGIFDSSMNPLMYMPAATVGDGTVAGYAIIADDPHQIFVCQGDGAFTAADMDYNYEVTPATLNSSTLTSTMGLSYMQIKAASGNTTTSTIPIRLLGQAFPQSETYSSAYAKMLCMIQPDCHYRGAGAAL